jgi:moderate conductance mechanosensitive channel
MFNLSPDVVDDVLHRIVLIILIVVTCVVITKLSMGTIRRLIRRTQARADADATNDERIEINKRFGTILALAGYLIKGFVLAIGGLLILDQLGINVGPAIAGLGVVGIALAFGAQAIVRDFFSGIMILFENQYATGDTVEIAGVTGVVEELTLRRTVVRDVDGIVHSVPNGEIKVASNRTRIWRRINYDVLVTYGTDIERATQIFDQVGADLAADPGWSDRIIEAPRVDHVEQLGERGITLKILGRVKATAMVAVTGELRRRILIAATTNALHPPPPGSTSDPLATGALRAFGPFAPAVTDDDQVPPEPDAVDDDQVPPDQAG